MGRVISINNPKAESLSNPATRAETYFAEAMRNVQAAREAIGQVGDAAEQTRLRSGFLVVANEAIEGTVDGA